MLCGGSGWRAGNSLDGSCAQQQQRAGLAQPGSSNCTTKIEPVKLSQRWTIENFASAMKLASPGSCLRSQVFKNAKFGDACWQLCLYPGGKRVENAGFVSLFLKMSATSPGKEVLQKAEYRFFFLDDAGQARFSNVNIGEFHAKPPKGGHSWGLRNIPRQKVVQSLRTDGSLLILCEVELLADVNRIRSLEARPRALAPQDLVQVPHSFIAAQRRLLERKLMTDCSISAGEAAASFSAHKCVLAAHSQVFEAMFQHAEVKESQESLVTIDDFPAAAVRTFLDYLYTGGVSEQEHVDIDHLQHVLGLADKYAVDALKAVCQDALVSRLNTNNCCQLLAVADLHSADTLKNACISLFDARKREIVAADGWRQLKEHHLRLATEILEHSMQSSDGAPPNKRIRTTI